MLWLFKHVVQDSNFHYVWIKSLKIVDRIDSAKQFEVEKRVEAVDGEEITEFVVVILPEWVRGSDVDTDNRLVFLGGTVGLCIWKLILDFWKIRVKVKAVFEGVFEIVIGSALIKFLLR